MENQTKIKQQYDELIEVINNNVTGSYPGIIIIPLICRILDKYLLKGNIISGRDKMAVNKAKNKAINQYRRILK